MSENRMARLTSMQTQLTAGASTGDGGLSARERMASLLDANSFVELGAYTQSPQEDGLNAGVIIGFGTIEGRLVYAFVQDASVAAGAMNSVAAAKIARVMDLALQNGAPLLSIMDSAGLKLAEGAMGLDSFALLLQKRTTLSGVVPQISIILGPCAGSQALFPAMGDFIIMSEQKNAKLATVGTGALVAAGGAKPTVGNAGMHAESTGLCTIMVETEAQALARARELLSFLPENNLTDAPHLSPEDSPVRLIPELDALADGSSYDDVREILAAVVDNGAMMECSPKYATAMVTAFAHVGGTPVGIVATQRNQGKIGGAACAKTARFVRFCDAFHIPVITFVDSEGFVVDSGEEQSGLLAKSAGLAFAYAQAVVPKVTVIIGRAIGGAFCVLGARSLGADVVLAWPNAEIAAMSAEAATAIVGTADIASAADPVAARAAYAEQYRQTMADPWTAAKQGVLDDVIAPASTRAVLSNLLMMLMDKRANVVSRKHANAPLL